MFDEYGNYIGDTGNMFTSGAVSDPYYNAFTGGQTSYYPAYDGTYGSGTTSGIDWSSIAKNGSPIANSLLGLASSAMGANASQSAADRLAAAYGSSSQLDTLRYLENVQRMQPYYTAGVGSLNALTGMLPYLTTPYSMSQYTNSPEYLSQLLATNQSDAKMKGLASASGMYGSGNMAYAMNQEAMKNALQGYQTGLQDYWSQNQNISNQLQPLITGGQNAGLGVANMGATNAANVGANTVGAGNALAAGGMNQAQQWQSGINNLATQLTSGINNFNTGNNQNALSGLYWGTGG